MLASYLLDATRPGHPLEETSLEHLGYKALDRGGHLRARREGGAVRAAAAGRAADLRRRARGPGATAVEPAGAAARHRPARAGLSRARNAARAGAGGHRARRHPYRRPGAGRAVAAHRAGAGAHHRRDLRAGRRGVQHQLAAAARQDPVREAAADPGEEDRQNAVGLDGGRSARGAGADPRSAAARAGVARAAQAEEHLHRRAAADGASGNRPRAHLLQPGGCGHRTPEQLRPEPAEHPDPHRARPPDPPRVRRRAGQRPDLSRLLADRAARARAHGRRGCADRGVPHAARTSTSAPG